MDRLRGDRRGLPLTEQEHTFLYERAMQGSRKDAARVTGHRSGHHIMASIFEKLDVEDLVSAFWKMGWLRPVPFGVSDADVRDERLREGEAILDEFWKRQSHHRDRE